VASAVIASVARALALALLVLAAAEAAAESKKLSATPNRHGAIAQYRPLQAWGVSHGFARQHDASVEALRQCANPKCEVVHKYRNGCAALADGPKKSFAASGATRAEAEAKAQRRCEEGSKGGACTLLAWGCTR
jgi:hypothetical protein